MSVRFLVRYLRATQRHEERTLTFMMYVTESLRLKGEGKYLTLPWYDMLDRRQEVRSAEEIIDHVVSRLNGGE